MTVSGIRCWLWCLLFHKPPLLQRPTLLLLTKAYGPVPDGIGGPPCVTEVEWVDRAISPL